MREILFRGKHKFSGKWVEGWFVGKSRKAPYKPPLRNKPQIITVEDLLCFEVFPETVGQYTGLTDRNGKKIFEGDIVNYTEEIETKSKGKETLKGIYKVEFEYCGFSPLDCLACNHLEIIGNIHDNPELIN